MACLDRLHIKMVPWSCSRDIYINNTILGLFFPMINYPKFLYIANTPCTYRNHGNPAATEVIAREIIFYK